MPDQNADREIVLAKLDNDHKLARLGLQGTLYGALGSVIAIVAIAVIQVLTGRNVIEGWAMPLLWRVACRRPRAGGLPPVEIRQVPPSCLVGEPFRKAALAPLVKMLAARESLGPGQFCRKRAPEKFL
jgi:hypothetical protein